MKKRFKVNGNPQIWIQEIECSCGNRFNVHCNDVYLDVPLRVGKNGESVMATCFACNESIVVVNAPDYIFQYLRGQE